MSSELLCKDCKHSFITFWSWLQYSGKYRYYCRKSYEPAESKVDPVTGPYTTKPSYASCSIARIEHKTCGPEAKLWEPKHKKHFFLAIKHSER